MDITVYEFQIVTKTCIFKKTEKTFFNCWKNFSDKIYFRSLWKRIVSIGGKDGGLGERSSLNSLKDLHPQKKNNNNNGKLYQWRNFLHCFDTCQPRPINPPLLIGHLRLWLSPKYTPLKTGSNLTIFLFSLNFPNNTWVFWVVKHYVGLGQPCPRLIFTQ